jgi:hypothetical protein
MEITIIGWCGYYCFACCKVTEENYHNVRSFAKPYISIRCDCGSMKSYFRMENNVEGTILMVQAKYE